MAIGKYIKKLRNERGWSQRMLSYKTGLSNAAISKIENGIRIPEIDSLSALAKAFDIDRSILIALRDGDLEEEALSTREESHEREIQLNGMDLDELLEYIHKSPEYKTLLSKSQKLDKEKLLLLIQMIDSMK